MLLFLSHLKPGGICCEGYGETCWTSSLKEKGWSRSALADSIHRRRLGNPRSGEDAAAGLWEGQAAAWCAGHRVYQRPPSRMGRDPLFLKGPTDKPRRRDFCFFLFPLQCNLSTVFFEGESHRCCPSFPFSSPDSGGCFSLATLISSQAPPCWDGGTLFLENHFNRKIPLQVPMTHSLCLFGAEAWGLQWGEMEICFSRMQLLLQPVLSLFRYWSVPFKLHVWHASIYLMWFVKKYEIP